jgi:hypothetical protein
VFAHHCDTLKKFNVFSTHISHQEIDTQVGGGPNYFKGTNKLRKSVVSEP